MNVGIIGAGAIGRTLARLWSEAGHDVMLSSRHPESIRAHAAALGATAGSSAQAAGWGDAVLLAVNYAGVDEAIEAISPHVAGKVVIDATNPLAATAGGGTERLIGDDELALRVTSEKLPDARLAKAFTTMWSGYLEKEAHREGDRAAVALASDDAEAKRIVEDLIRDAGFEPVDLGGVADSRPLDPPSPIWNKVLTADEVRDRLSARAAAPSPGAHERELGR